MKRFGKLVTAGALVVSVLAVSVGGAAAASPNGQGNGAGQGGAAWGGAATTSIVSKLLGIDQATIVAERHAGSSLTEIAAERSVTKDQLVNAIVNEKQIIVAEQVANGTLTQEQADVINQNIQERVSTAVDRTTTGPAAERGQAGDGQGLGLGRGSGNGNGTGLGNGSGYGPGDGSGVCVSPDGPVGGMQYGLNQ